jgi:hypothetical protein
MPSTSPGRILVIGCGALANELVALTRGLPNVDVTCLPATLHNRPGGIPEAVRDRIRRRRSAYEAVFVAYADCGTGGLLDRVLAEEGVERLPGAHCYEVFAGRTEFERLTDEEHGTFFLTDFLVRNFERLVWRGLGLDRHPELLPTYFGNYRRVVYLAQTRDRALEGAARIAAARLGLAYGFRFTGVAELGGGLRGVGVMSPTADRGTSTTAVAVRRSGHSARPTSSPTGERVNLGRPAPTTSAGTGSARSADRYARRTSTLGPIASGTA